MNSSTMSSARRPVDSMFVAPAASGRSSNSSQSASRCSVDDSGVPYRFLDSRVAWVDGASAMMSSAGQASVQRPRSSSTIRLIESNGDAIKRILAGFVKHELFIHETELERFLKEQGRQLSQNDLNALKAGVLRKAASQDENESIAGKEAWGLLKKYFNISPKDITDCIKALKSLEARQAYDIQAELRLAVKSCDIDKIWTCIVMGAKPEEALVDYLCILAGKGRIDIIKMLVEEFGMDVNARNAKGQTVMHLVAQSERDDILKELVKLGGGLDSLDNARKSPLYYAVTCGRAECAIFLIEACASIAVERPGEAQKMSVFREIVYLNEKPNRDLVKAFLSRYPDRANKHRERIEEVLPGLLQEIGNARTPVC